MEDLIKHLKENLEKQKELSKQFDNSLKDLAENYDKGYLRAIKDVEFYYLLTQKLK